MFLKKLFLLISSCLALSILVAQSKNDYESNWKKVDSLINKKGLTESALVEVNKVYALAKKEKNDAQIIKALLYRMSLQQRKEEDAIQKSISDLEKELSIATEPSKSILNSIAAESYWHYLQQHRWQLYDRTQTINYRKDDIASWGIDDFHRKISELYLSSLKNEKLLQQTKLEPFDAIILKGNTRYLRPTLFDLLAHRALNYFKNDERNLNKPAYVFEINDPNALAEATIFVNHKFTTKDTLSLHFKALLLYQRILAFHLKDSKPDALIDADIDRMEFVYAHGVMANKEELYRVSLQKIASVHGSLPVAAQAWYLLAQMHAHKARQYDASRDTMYRFEWLAAKSIMEKIIQSSANSEGKTNSQNLLNEMLQKELNFQVEKVNVPQQPFRVLVNYRNFIQLHFRVIPLDKATKEKLGNNVWEEDYWKSLLQLAAIKTFSQTLPDTKDHQKHAVEVRADGPGVGEYALVASVNNDFSLSKNLLAVQFFHVSNIAYINNGIEYFALHRETGQPLARATVQVWQRTYDYTKQRYADNKGASLIADNNGYFKVPQSKTNTRNTDNSLRLELTHNNDRLFLDDYTYHYFPGERNPEIIETKSTFLFTDRSIYRPGQTVYFKGIVLNKHEKETESNILPYWKTKLVLYDVNGQKTDSISLTTSEFGSYSGKFILPATVLNGTFHIKDENTNSVTYISVEEYKRPKFFVEIKKPSGTYKVNDTISVTGTVKAYAGNNINNALVKYRVTRKIMIPFWKYGYGRHIWPPRAQEQMEITNGEVETNTTGEFTIGFKAIPDNSIDKKDQPVFYYEVTADVTDINGETRSGISAISVAYQALQMNINIPDQIHTDSIHTIKISTTNLNNIFEKANVAVIIYSLKTPDRLFRQRYWQRPDQFVMSREEYYKLFPYDIYSDEDDVSKWERKEKVVEKKDTTATDSRFLIGNLQLKAGWYVIEAITKDKYGEEVKALRYVQLFNSRIVSPAAFGSIQSEKVLADPGEKISYRVRTNLDNVFIIHDISRDTARQRHFINLNQDNVANQDHTLSITEKDRGGVLLTMAFVKHNRVYADNVLLDVPFTNKQLNISFETYRDKTLPGSDEKWKVRISGYKTDRVTAELLTAMYDASLDQFKPHAWQTPSIWKKAIQPGIWGGVNNFSAGMSQEKHTDVIKYESFEKKYDAIAFLWNYYGPQRRSSNINKDLMAEAQGAPPGALQELVIRGTGVKKRESVPTDHAGDTSAGPPSVRQDISRGRAVQVRKNFNETAFFFPDLKTDTAGNIEFSFTMPEALTQWKWMLLAHTKDLSFGLNEKTIITQKELMVQPNPPRFMREGDRMDFSGKITNLSSKELTGQVELQIIDPSTNQPVDGWFRNMFPNQYFTAAAGQSVPVSFTIEVPFQYNRPVTYRLIASSGDLKDGEEMMLPVVSNQVLVTESMPLPMRGNKNKQFKFEKLLQSGNSETLTHHALSVEFTTNPAWYAVQALPYLLEYPYECSEQTFNKFYANSLAFKIANSSPRIKQIFERWKTADTAALLSNLQKNEELKSVLLQETPWVLQAQNEAQQKRNIALLFDMVRMGNELESSLNKLHEMQTPNGGFVWFKGGPDDRYITQYILTGIGHLQKLDAIPERSKVKINALTKQALGYLDKKLRDDYDNLIKNKISLETNNLGYLQIQFLYMRSFFINNGVGGETLKAYTYYRKQSQQFWLQQSRYMQGMIALSLHRTGDIQAAKNITASLKQNALVSEEAGMYWKDVTSGYYWHQAPVETQSLLIEAFTEITNDKKVIEDCKTWLLKQKQVQNWRTTKATADACYVLLLQGNDWLTSTPAVTIVVGDQAIKDSDQPAEAGTGYFKKTIAGKSVQPEMGNVQVFISNSGNTAMPSWGAVYWQYFENLDKITPAATPLKLTKKLFMEKYSDRGPVLQPVNEGEILQVGDKVKVRIELRSDRDMEYVHMKDVRGACMEPANVISQYKWQGGLGYYETTKDASTNFFFDWLPKGTYVFEYPMFVTHAGTYSNGVTTIQCMYAPEFTSHSEGVRVNVEQ